MRLSSLLFVGCLVSLPAAAQATRTWVSGVGDDANPCSRTAPCKTFAGAISKTAAGGEIDVLDPGGFGAVTITKAITIDGHNVLAGIVVAGTNAINVAAGANDVVVLRGLSITSTAATPGLVGVRFTSGKALHVEDCTIQGFSTHGLSFEPASLGAQLFVKNTAISEITPATTTAAAINLVGGVSTLDRVTLTNNNNGVVASTAAKLTLHRANISGSSTSGLHAFGMTFVNIERSVFAGNATGVLTEVGADVRMSDTMLSQNGVGLSGDVASFGNNRVTAGNGTNGAPTSTLPQQ